MTKQSSYFHDTIAAPITAWGHAGVGIVRLSGPGAIPALEKIFRPARRIKPPLKRSIIYGRVIDGDDTVDEALVFLMPAPASYTREDVVEISSHGGPAVIRKILELAVKNGARPAEPGEFTKRAFLNGRIDLVQAEAVSDIINAKSELAAKISAGQLEGMLSQELEKIRSVLIEAAAACDAACDFPEDDTDLVIGEVGKKLNKSRKAIKKLLDGFEKGKLYQEGVKIVITGKTNVGKSSLINALTGKDRAIVTPVAGTTRDVIREPAAINGIPAEIYDTAGIRKSARGLIEKIGVKKSMEALEGADVIIFLFDASKKLDEADFGIMKLLRKYDSPVIYTGNKTDLGKIHGGRKAGKTVSYISCLKGTGLEKLKSRIYSLLTAGKNPGADEVLLTSVRHAGILKNALRDIDGAFLKLEKEPAESAWLTEEALGSIDTITGRNFREDVIDEIFSKFCIGK